MILDAFGIRILPTDLSESVTGCVQYCLEVIRIFSLGRVLRSSGKHTARRGDHSPIVRLGPPRIRRILRCSRDSARGTGQDPAWAPAETKRSDTVVGIGPMYAPY